MSNSGKVQIHGREYKTVALRVQEFREAQPDWTIATEIIQADDLLVIMKASIIDAEGRIRGTGHAEETRTSSQINRTSALENCETSAIGRALAACGYAGSEYASANEVQNAIQQQENAFRFKKGEKEKVYEQVLACLTSGDGHGLKEVLSEYETPEEKMAVWALFNSRERSSIKELTKDI